MRGQKGLTLVETLIALAILGVIAVSIFLALDVSQKTTANVDQRTTAESLTRTALEYIKNSPYDSSLDPGHPRYDVDPSIDLNGDPYNGRYSITVTAERLYPSGTPTPNDQGLQKVTVGVYFEDAMTARRLVMPPTDAYKVQR